MYYLGARNGIWDIIEHYGTEHQLIKLAEEAGELVQASLKYVDKPNTSTFANLIEEIADVALLTEQVKTIFDISDSELETIMMEKIERERRRIRNGN